MIFLLWIIRKKELSPNIYYIVRNFIENRPITREIIIDRLFRQIYYDLNDGYVRNVYRSIKFQL